MPMPAVSTSMPAAVGGISLDADGQLCYKVDYFVRSLDSYFDIPL
jgi:hypothetical protein